MRARMAAVVGLSVPVASGAHIDLIRGCGAFDIIPGWAPFSTLPLAERIAALKDTSYREAMKQSLLKAAADGFGLARTFAAAERLLVEVARELSHAGKWAGRAAVMQ